MKVMNGEDDEQCDLLDLEVITWRYYMISCPPDRLQLNKASFSSPQQSFLAPEEYVFW